MWTQRVSVGYEYFYFKKIYLEDSCKIITSYYWKYKKELLPMEINQIY